MLVVGGFFPGRGPLGPPCCPRGRNFPVEDPFFSVRRDTQKICSHPFPLSEPRLLFLKVLDQLGTELIQQENLQDT